MLGKRCTKTAGKEPFQSSPRCLFVRVIQDFLVGNGLIAVRRGDAQCFAVGCVVLFGNVGGKLNRHGGDIGAIGQDLGSHLTSLVAQVVVADGQGGNTAALADAFLTGDNGDFLRDDHIGDGLGVGSSGVIGGDVDHVRGSSSGLGDRGDIVGIGESVAGGLDAHLIEVALDDIALVDGVGLGAAVQQANSLSVREHLLDHGCLLVQRGQVRGTGDVVAHGAGPVRDVQRSGVVGNRGAEDGNVGGSLGSSLQRGGGVGQDQIDASGDKAADDGGAVGGIAGSVLLVKLDVALAQLLGQSVLEALGGGVQRLVLDQLADADGIDLVVGAFGGGSFFALRGGRCGGGISSSGAGCSAAASCQTHGHGSCHSE